MLSKFSKNIFGVKLVVCLYVYRFVFRFVYIFIYKLHISVLFFGFYKPLTQILIKPMTANDRCASYN